MLETALSALSELHSSWMVRAGAILKGKGMCEVSGRVSYGGEGLEVVNRKSFELPLYVATAEETCTVEDCETACELLQTREVTHVWCYRWWWRWMARVASKERLGHCSRHRRCAPSGCAAKVIFNVSDMIVCYVVY